MPVRTIYYDTETTGVRPDEDRIIEIAAYDPEGERKFCKFIHPERPIPAESTLLTSITDEMVSQADHFDVVGREFIEFCGEHSILIAHNNDKFDRLFLETECLRTGLKLPAWRYIDTLKWSRKYRNDLPSHALQSLRSFYGFPMSNQSHRAMDDTITLYQIFSKMIDDLDIETVHRLLYSSQQMERMPFGKYRGKPFHEIPHSYLEWLQKSGALDKSDLENLKASLMQQKLLK